MVYVVAFNYFLALVAVYWGLGYYMRFNLIVKIAL